MEKDKNCKNCMHLKGKFNKYIIICSFYNVIKKPKYYCKDFKKKENNNEKSI